jgi:hypothetical protein
MNEAINMWLGGFLVGHGLGMITVALLFRRRSG